MNKQELEKLKFPIGKFYFPTNPTHADIERSLSILRSFPMQIEAITSCLKPIELNYRYRPEGWTIKQVVHHCADSHINCIMRFKLTLTEDVPTIKPYDQNKWAQLPDAQSEDLSSSIKILFGVHARLVSLLESISNESYKRKFIHPGLGKEITLAQNTTLYAWHSQHHYAHIEQALKYRGNF